MTTYQSNITIQRHITKNNNGYQKPLLPREPGPTRNTNATVSSPLPVVLQTFHRFTHPASFFGPNIKSNSNVKVQVKYVEENKWKAITEKLQS